MTPGSTSRPATSQPPYLGRKPNAKVATDGVRDRLRHAHSSYLKNVSVIKNGASHRNPEDQGGFTMHL